MRRRKRSSPSLLSPVARRWRWASWFAASVAASGSVMAVQGARGAVPAASGMLGAVAAVSGFGLILLCGIQARKHALDERAHQSSSTLLIALATKLRDQDDATLQRLAQVQDDAGQAARLILQGRAERSRQSKTSPPATPPAT